MKLKLTENIKHVLVVLFLLPIILLFYWMLTFKLVVPQGDGMIPLSVYSYIYSSFINFGKIFLWDPFTLGGNEDLLVTYTFHGFSPLNPLLYIWLFISNIIHLKVYQSYYFYFLLNIWLGAIFTYFLGYKHLFKNKTSSIYLALVFAISGYFVSNTPIMNFILPYAWLPICLFFGLNCINQNRISDYLFLTFGIFIISLTYSPIFIGILLYLLFFLATSFVFKITETRNLKKYFINIVIFIILFIVSNLGLIFTFIHYMRDGIRTSGGIPAFFFGNEYTFTHFSMDLQWIFNTFIPNTFLDLWGNYGNGGLWINQFYYIGFASFSLCIISLIYFIKNQHKFAFFFGLIIATLFTLFYSSGHALLHLFNKLNSVIRYPEFSRVLVIFTFMIFSGFGFNFLFINSLNNNKKRLLKLIFAFVLILSWILSIITLILFTNFGKKFGNYPPYLIYTFSYSFIIGVCYGISVCLNKKWLFIIFLIFDLFFFLSRSYPFTNSDALQKPLNFSFTSYIINNNTSFKMPSTLNYSTSKEYPGMHFGMGPLLHRETAALSSLKGYMPKRRLFFFETILNNIFNEKNDSFHALQILGITKSRYFFTDSALLVENTKDILPSLKKLYKQSSWHFTTPIIISKNENPVFNTSNINIPDKSMIKLYQNNDEYKKNADIPTNWRQINMDYKDFSILLQDKNQKILIYNKNLPKNNNLITENNVLESICGELTDNEGISYYPVSSDIFNFIPSILPFSNYVIHHSHFYAIYPDKNGNLKLFIRMNNSNNNINYQYKYSNDCNNKIGKEGKLVKKEQNIQIRTIKYQRGELNKFTIFNTYLPEIPSFFGEYINRSSLINSKTNKILTWHLPESIEETYSIHNNVIYFYKNVVDNPFIDANYKINYSIFQKDLFKESNLTLEKDLPDEIVFKTSKEKSSLLIIRNLYNRDWSATIDGKKTDIYIINGLYMGISVSSGKHKIVFSYNPIIIRLMTIINPIFLFIAFGVLLFEKIVSSHATSSNLSSISNPNDLG